MMSTGWWGVSGWGGVPRSVLLIHWLGVYVGELLECAPLEGEYCGNVKVT
jgi:hypothetical protein